MFSEEVGSPRLEGIYQSTLLVLVCPRYQSVLNKRSLPLLRALSNIASGGSERASKDCQCGTWPADNWNAHNDTVSLTGGGASRETAHSCWHHRLRTRSVQIGCASTEISARPDQQNRLGFYNRPQRRFLGQTHQRGMKMRDDVEGDRIANMQCC